MHASVVISSPKERKKKPCDMCEAVRKQQERRAERTLLDYKTLEECVIPSNRPGPIKKALPPAKTVKRPRFSDLMDEPLGRVVEKDGLDHARQDLRHVNADDLRDHLREVDAHLQGLSLDEEVVSELMQVPHNRLEVVQ